MLNKKQCYKCKQALHFHHKDKEEKEISLAMAYVKGWSIKRNR